MKKAQFNNQDYLAIIVGFLILVFVLWASFVFHSLFGYEDANDRLLEDNKRLRQDSINTHRALLKCNGTISRYNNDSTFVVE